MTKGIVPVLSVFSLIAMAAGVLLSLYAILRHLSAAAPSVGSWCPSNWRPVWKTRDWFSGATGFWFYLVGVGLMSVGALVLFLVFVFGP